MISLCRPAVCSVASSRSLREKSQILLRLLRLSHLIALASCCVIDASTLLFRALERSLYCSERVVQTAPNGRSCRLIVVAYCSAGRHMSPLHGCVPTVNH
ncbi:hypothetical protein J3A83DRAFT_363378 [Scleroderma citrinum]